MPVNETRHETAEGLRKASKLADDTMEYGADLVESGVSATTSVAKGFVRIPTSMLNKIADLLDSEDKKE